MSRARALRDLKKTPVLYVFLLVGVLGLVADFFATPEEDERAAVVAQVGIEP